jgi:hypothetical protein
MLKSASEVTLIPKKIFFSKNFELRAKFRGVQAWLMVPMNEFCLRRVTATAVSVAAASVPSAALALMLIVLEAINVPTAKVSLLFTVDWFV